MAMGIYRMRLERTESRRRWRELTDLIIDWDPVGLIGAGCPRDEYDDIVGFTLRALEAATDRERLANSVADYIGERYGFYPGDAGPFAAQAVEWYRSRWPDSYL